MTQPNESEQQNGLASSIYLKANMTRMGEINEPICQNGQERRWNNSIPPPLPEYRKYLE